MTNDDQPPNQGSPEALALSPDTPISDTGASNFDATFTARLQSFFNRCRPGAHKVRGAVSALTPLLADLLGRYLSDEKMLAATKKQLVTYLVEKRRMKRKSAESAVDGALKVARAIHAQAQKRGGK